MAIYSQLLGTYANGGSNNATVVTANLYMLAGDVVVGGQIVIIDKNNHKVVPYTVEKSDTTTDFKDPKETFYGILAIDRTLTARITGETIVSVATPTVGDKIYVAVDPTKNYLPNSPLFIDTTVGKGYRFTADQGVATKFRVAQRMSDDIVLAQVL